MSTLRSHKAVLIYLLACVVAARGVKAAGEQPSLEYQVKAAFLLNFTKFIDWPPTEPADQATPAGLCILGDDPFGQVLEQMVEGETLHGKKLSVQRVQRPVPPSCQVLYINGSEKDPGSLLAGLGPGVLTVGEGNGFLREGGMIAFVIENHKVRFDIDQGAAAKAGLRLSSKLLNVARSVER